MSSEDADGEAAEPGVNGSGAGAAASPPDTTPEADRTERLADPSDAFQVLGNEIRMGVLETMLDRVDGDGSSRATFSELFDASSVDTSAGFAYHLEQLVGAYLRKVEVDDGPRYELTHGGRAVARAIAAGAFTHRVDHPSIELDDPCPFCEKPGLAASVTDNVVSVTCGECDRTLLSLGFPPSGFAAHGDRFPAAFDRHHRHGLSLFRAGVCPACSGDVEGRLVATDRSELPDELTDHVQASFACRQCGHDVRCPVSLALLQHPAVVAFYRDHGRDVRERPIWNVGHEWAESILSEEPLAVRVVVELDGDVLACYVGEDVRVREVQRTDERRTDEDRRADEDRTGEDPGATERAETEHPGPNPRDADRGESVTGLE